jgi:hypothetical protein
MADQAGSIGLAPNRNKAVQGDFPSQKSRRAPSACLQHRPPHSIARAEGRIFDVSCPLFSEIFDTLASVVR